MAGVGALFVRTRLQEVTARAALLPISWPVPDFTLTNQHGRAVSLADLRGQVWIADIIFTRCAGPCPVMTQRLSGLQARLPAGEPVQLVTLTTDPDFDTPAVLRQYGERFGADFGRWQFLTGAKAQIAALAVDGLKLIAQEKKPEERLNPADLFIHSELFVVVDRRGQVRAALQSYEPDTPDRLVAVVKKLLRERQP
jgi:protein SCO1/2